MEQQIQEAVDFFKSEGAYRKLFKLFRNKYESLGRIGGTIPINSFSEDEIRTLAKFFGVASRELVQKNKISLQEFEKQLTFTRFDLVTLKPLLDTFFGETIISNREKRLREEKNLQRFFIEQKQVFPDLSFWLDWLLGHRRESRWLIQLAEQTPDEFINLLATLQRAFTSLPTKAERLPLFSQRITSDPHAFDLHTSLGKAFINLLTVNFNRQHVNTIEEIPRNTEAINGLLQQYHIYRDDLLNFVTCNHLISETKSGVHPVWKEAAEHQTVQIVPLREIIPLTRVYPKVGHNVWVIENSGVYATLLDNNPNIPMICTNGQFTLAALLLMDLLVEAGVTLHFASDFDPEGLGMAERLLDRYDNSLKLWRMDIESYRLSKPQVELSDTRLEKLTGIMNEKLREIAMEMLHIKKAGYQEALIDLMVKDLEQWK